MTRKTMYVLWSLLLLIPALVSAQTDVKGPVLSPTLTVTGHGEVSAAPDQAVLRLGAVSQAKEAAAAQQQAAKIVSAVLEKLAKMNIPKEKITTVGLTLAPVFSRQNPKALEEILEPAITGYRARNSIQVLVDDMGALGPVIDAGVSAGVNQLEGLYFELKEDAKHKDQALRLAVQQARRKADAIAAAMGVEIEAVDEIVEGGINVIRPQMQMARALAVETATPVEPGQVSVEATVTVRYRIAGGGKLHNSGKTAQ